MSTETPGTCPTCGSHVRIVSGGEGTCYYLPANEPIPEDASTSNDRERPSDTKPVRER